MRVLLSNDDGVHASGLKALAAAVRAEDIELWVAAPSKEHSAQSHAFTLHKPLRAHEVSPRWFSVSGTPADCVYLGVHGLLPERPDVVISGINRGSNLGWDVHYSGTVAAAREAAFSGVPSIAVSLNVRHGATSPHWETAQHVVGRVVAGLRRGGLAPGIYVNVNVPDVPLAELRGLRWARLGVRRYEAAVDARIDPRGRPYYWLGGRHASFDEDPETDGRLCEQGWATLTPMHADPTDRAALSRLPEEWKLDAP